MSEEQDPKPTDASPPPAEAPKAPAPPTEGPDVESSAASPPAGAPAADAPTDSGEAGDPRRPRRRRRVTTKSEGDAPRPPRKRGPRPRKDDRKRGDDEGAPPVMAAPDRAVFTQDIVMPPPPEKPPSAVKEMPDASKITLLLHPAPKAGKGGPKKKTKEPKTAKEAMAAKARRNEKAKGGKQQKQEKAPKVKLKAAWKTAGMDDAVEAILAAAGSAEDLVKEWIEAGNAAAIAAAAHADEVTGKARKAARRAIGVLKSRGIEVPEIVTQSPILDDGPDEPVAVFIPPDATGVLFFSISQRRKGGRYDVADAVIRPTQGIIQVSSGKIAGHKIRDWKQRVEEQFGTAPVEVPVEWARHMIAEGRKENDASGTIVPLGFDTAAPMFGPAPDEPPPHPVADLGELDDATVEKAAVDSEKLHAAPEFRGWIADRDAVDALLAKVGQKLQGGEDAQDAEKVNSVLDDEVGEACDRYFTPERREALAERMRHSAISVRDRDGDDAAREVLAVAAAIERAGLVTKPPRELGFLMLFFRKAVAWMAQQNQGQLRLPA